MRAILRTVPAALTDAVQRGGGRRRTRSFAGAPWAALAALALLIAFVGCGGDDDSSAAGAGDGGEQRPVTFQFDFTPNGSHAPFLLADERGYFAEEGIDAEFIPGKGSQVSVDAVHSGHVEFAKAAAPNVIIGVANDQDVVSVASLVGKGVFGFFVPEDSQIEEIRDLEGAEILSAAGTPQAALLPSILRLHGLEESAVDIANISPSALLNTYAQGEGDALVTDIPFGTPVVQPQRPSRTLPWADNGLPVPGYSIITNRETLEQDPELVAAFLRAAYRGHADALEAPDDAIQALVDEFPTVDREVAAEQLEVIGDYLCPDDFAGEPFGLHSEADWEIGVEEMRSAADLDGSADPTDYYTNEFFTGEDSVAADEC